MAKKKGRMGDLGDRTYHRTDDELTDEEAEILLNSEPKWNELRLIISDPDLYDELIYEIKESSENNEGLARLKGRIGILEEGIKLAREIIDLI